MLRILLVDDHVLFRKGIASLLTSREDLEVVGEAGNGAEAITAARELLPDIILMDINMPICDGLEATRKIKKEATLVKIKPFHSVIVPFSISSRGAETR